MEVALERWEGLLGMTGTYAGQLERGKGEGNKKTQSETS